MGGREPSRIAAAPTDGVSAASPPARREHGGVVAAELAALGIDPADVLDCSASINPYAPHAAMIAAIRGAAIDRYPDAAATAARAALARRCDVTPDRVVLGNGAAELLWSLARVLVRSGVPVIVPVPSFAEFSAAAAVQGGAVIPVRGADAATIPQPSAIDAAVVAHPSAVVYVCAPANPTGDAVRADDIAPLAAAHPDATVVVDEAFLALSEHAADAARTMPANVVRVRSLTKEHAVPGVRVGYALASAAVAARLDGERAAWTTNAMAQAAAIAACELDVFVAESRARLLRDRDAFVESLRAVGLTPRPTSTFYFVVPVGDGAALRARLLRRHHVLVRDCASFGMPDHVRIATRRPEENARVVAALTAEVDR